ncbi:MAG: uncharacterized protein JWM53_3509 [bacterium]|nr:uncharacterized protein [bacterium]
MFFQAQVQTRHPILRSAITRACRLALPPSHADGSPRVHELSASLERDGNVSLGRLLTDAQIDEVLAYLDGRTCSDPDEPRLPPFSPDRPPAQSHVGGYDSTTILAAPHLLRLANDPTLLGIAARYLGCRPTISNLSLWWSFPDRDAPKEAQLYHRDRDDWRFCKLFVYLTDVDDDNGPHVFVEGSHRSARVSELKKRYTDAEVEGAYPASSIKRYAMARGHAFLEDTFGVHKGLLPRTRRRLLFQAQYSLFPIAHYQYSPIGRERLGAGLPPDLDPYINRLHLAPA